MVWCFALLLDSEKLAVFIFCVVFPILPVSAEYLPLSLASFQRQVGGGDHAPSLRTAFGSYIEIDSLKFLKM